MNDILIGCNDTTAVDNAGHANRAHHGNQLGRQILRGMLRGIFGGRRLKRRVGKD